MRIPFVDLQSQYKAISDEIDSALNAVIEKKSFINGPFVRQLEEQFCHAHEVDHAVGCSNGTQAITLSLRSLGIGPGDEVITTTHTFIATVEAILEVGATPVLVDICPETYNMDLSEVESHITTSTKAIIAVHLYGNPLNLTRLSKIAKDNNLVLIEDCAQAHLAKWAGKPVGSYGQAGTFSFYPGKNLGAYGDAGMVISNCASASTKMRMLIDHGRSKKYEHSMYGYNYRMDDIQAAVLLVKLKYLHEWTEKRRKCAANYDEILNHHNFKTIKIHSESYSVYHLYVVEVSNRDNVIARLNSDEISTGIHYPIPLHLQQAHKYINGKKRSFPFAENAASRILSLPIYPELTENQQQFILDKFLKIAKN